MEREAPGLLNIDVANMSLLLEHPGTDCDATEFSSIKESKSGHSSLPSSESSSLPSSSNCIGSPLSGLGASRISSWLPWLNSLSLVLSLPSLPPHSSICGNSSSGM